jgi:hypothetical protein
MRRIKGHVAVCRGDGLRCACRLLNLGLRAFRIDTLEIRRRRGALFQRVVLYVTVSVVLALLFEDLLWEGARHFRIGTEAEAYVGAAIAGLAAGLLVAGLQSAMAALALVASYGGERLVRVGHHPDGAWIFLSGLVPVWRGRVRKRRLNRYLEAWGELIGQSAERRRLSEPETSGRNGPALGMRVVAAAGVGAGALVAASLLQELVKARRRAPAEVGQDPS